MSMTITDLVPEEEQHYSYLSELEGMELSEENTSWVHAAPIGKYKHPLYGKIDFTLERIQRFAQNVMANVRGIDLAIDYSHKSSDKAAGWVKKAETRSDGLWLLVEWTEAAADAIRNKEFRYFSPEFVAKYTDAKTGTKYSDVLLGGGLTNRPFLKDLVPVNLSEVIDEVEDTTEVPMAEEATETVASNTSGTTSTVYLSNDNVKLDEVLEEVKALREENAQLIATQKFNEADRLVERWESNGKWGLPPALHEQARTILLSENEDFSAFVDELLKVGLVKLGEDGSARTEGEEQDEPTEERDAVTRFNERITAYLNENPDAETGDAVEFVAADDPQLFDEYRAASYLGG